jgi:hypothetical protein
MERNLFTKSTDYVKSLFLAFYSFLCLFFYSLIYPVNPRNGIPDRNGSSNNHRRGPPPNYSNYYRFRGGMGGGG